MGLQVTEGDGSDAAGGVNQLNPGLKGALDDGDVEGGAGGAFAAVSSTSPILSGEDDDPLRNMRWKKDDERGERIFETSPSAVEVVG